jgi:hypothetical protein
VRRNARKGISALYFRPSGILLLTPVLSRWVKFCQIVMLFWLISRADLLLFTP